MKVRFPTDTDGFLSQECPSCHQQFKVIFGEGSSEPLSYCPYCRHNGHQCWYTQEQAEHLRAVAIDAGLNKLRSGFQGLSRGHIKLKLNPNLSQPAPPPIEIDGDYSILHFPCCGETIKATRHQSLFCIICGSEVDISVSDSKRLFLSHKGVDKASVINFKTTLELIGYDPWLDEDAMPAGTSLERGILQGMKDSCGVIFFITPSFQDEHYLAKEIEYAIQQKNEKGNKFSIIALQFSDEDGNQGIIPELLKTYVWKTPRTELDALREIIRALPIEPKLVDWRDGISDVTTIPIVKSTSIELSDEAKWLLKAATSDDNDSTIICADSLDGTSISAGKKSPRLDGSPRATARWKAAVKKLLKHGFIEDISGKGEVFEVTDDGFEASDSFTDEEGTGV